MEYLIKAKNFLAYRFTFMWVPHSGASPRQISFRLSTALLCLLSWTGLTGWSSYLSARQIDYWRTEVSNQVLRMKIRFLVGQLEQSKNFVEEVKTVEAQLRDLLQYKDGSSILKENPPIAAAATGGPTLLDQNKVTLQLEQADPDLAWTRLFETAGSFKSAARRQIASFTDVSGWISKQRGLLRAMPQGWPCPGRVTSHYGIRSDPFSGENEYHPGVDISGVWGTPVKATADGIVRIAGWNGGYGNLVVVQHGFGYSTRYAHNSRFVVKEGDRVKRGQTVALMGSTGKASGVHCHYEVWRNNLRRNPYAYLKGDYTDSEALARLSKAEKNNRI